ncbi:hypothetical protein [Pseudomonas amygdali]|uniref:hypothetical protein n=1 Tax=Pseudomonas amygdali TaxID=47877 RepID=UPI0010558366|nr:hypothetical protein [Pseudomonas amygdali]
MQNTLPSEALTADPGLGVRATIQRGQSMVGMIDAGSDEFVVVEGGAILLYALNSNGERFYLSIIGAGYVFTPQSVNAN